MRTIQFNELKLKSINDEESFYNAYLKNLQDTVKSDTSLHSPTKQYEIFYLDILGGKLILLNKDYIINNDYTKAELFFDYSTALKIYNLMLDIIDGIEDEKNEINELYKEERLQKDKEIEQLKDLDNELFLNKQTEYNSIINSDLYINYSRLQEENEQLKLENEQLKEQLKNYTLVQNSNIGFFQRFINKIKNKKLPKN